MLYASIWRYPLTAAPTASDSTNHAATTGENSFSAIVDARPKCSPAGIKIRDLLAHREEILKLSIPIAYDSPCGHQPGLHPILSCRKRDLIRMPVEVHDHARQQSAALVKFAEIEIAHFKSEIRGNVLQLAVLLKLELEIFGSGLQIVKVRRVENRVWQTNGIADT